MAITLLTSPTTPNPTVIGDWNLMAAQLTACKQLLGIDNRIVLTEFATTTIPQIADGSYFQHGGAIYIAQGNESIGNSGGISAGSVYIEIHDNGADELVANFIDDVIGYTWNYENNGLYDVATGYQALPYTIIYTVAGTLYTKRRILNLWVESSGYFLLTDSTGILYLVTSDLYFNELQTNNDHILFNDRDNVYEFYADDDGSKTNFGGIHVDDADIDGDVDIGGTLNSAYGGSVKMYSFKFLSTNTENEVYDAITAITGTGDNVYGTTGWRGGSRAICKLNLTATGTGTINVYNNADGIAAVFANGDATPIGSDISFIIVI